MKFDWSEYFNLAKELIDSDTNEAKQRSSISRAYYAAFCLARNYLRDYLEIKPRSDENKHKFVAEKFQHHDRKNQKMIEIGRDLSRLRSDRNKADYEDTLLNLTNKNKSALKIAENIINKINELKKED